MKNLREPLLYGLALLLSGAGLDSLCLSFAPELIAPALAQGKFIETTDDPQPAAKPAGANTPAPAAQTASGKALPACLSAIAAAARIDDASIRSGQLRDSLIAAQKLGPSARDMLIDMVHSATPAGRLLALALIKKLDAAEYKKQAEALKEESGSEKVSIVTPTERCHYIVSDILNDMAQKTPLIKLLPDMGAK